MEAWKNLFKKFFFVCKLALPSITFKKFFVLVKHIFVTSVMKKKCPSAVIMGVTYKCQLKCEYCSINRYPIDKKRELTTQEFKRVIDQSADLGIPKLNFFGGEPLLRNDLIELVAYASSKGMFVFLDTNGVLLTKKKVLALKKAGITNISINLFSYVESNDNECYKNVEHTFQNRKSILQYCMEENIPYIISVYVDKYLVINNKLEEIIQCAKNYGASGVRMTLPMQCGGLQGKEGLLTNEDIQRVEDLVDDYFVYHESILYGLKNGKRLCEARMKKTAYISPYGDIQFCYTVPHSFGNIRNCSLRLLIESMWNDKLFKAAPKCECAMNDSYFRNIFDQTRLKQQINTINIRKNLKC